MLTKHNGNLGESNSVAWMFSKKGYIVVDKAGADEEALLNAVLEAGGDDLRDDGEAWEILTSRRPSKTVRDAVKALGIEPASAQVAMLPQNYVKLEGKDATQMVKLMDALDDHDDVQAGLVELRHRREGNRGFSRVRHAVRVFGIDPGSECTGYGCVETDGQRHRLVICGGLRCRRARRSPNACD